MRNDQGIFELKIARNFLLKKVKEYFNSKMVRYF